MPTQHTTHPQPKRLTPRTLLLHAEHSDYLEEDALDYLEARHIRPSSHTRRTLYIQAWNAGWRPYGEVFNAK